MLRLRVECRVDLVVSLDVYKKKNLFCRIVWDLQLKVEDPEDYHLWPSGSAVFQSVAHVDIHEEQMYFSRASSKDHKTLTIKSVFLGMLWMIKDECLQINI